MPDHIFFRNKTGLFLLVILLPVFMHCSGQEGKPVTAEKECKKPLTANDSATFVSHTLQVTGEVEQALTLTVDSLKNMAVHDISDYRVLCQNADVPGEGRHCKGVLLKDILDKARLKKNVYKDRNFYIVARATDQYKATFSFGELFNNPTGDSTYVIFEENGKPIHYKGEMVLVCPTDRRTSLRHVIWLKSIEVYKVN